MVIIVSAVIIIIIIGIIMINVMVSYLIPILGFLVLQKVNSCCYHTDSIINLIPNNTG